METRGEGEILQAGFSVSKRHFKHAVKRNRIKRLMRESYRLQKGQLKTLLIKNDKKLDVFFIYTSSEIPSFTDVFEKMGQILERLEQVLFAK
jgi:ribonuclease P protein component